MKNPFESGISDKQGSKDWWVKKLYWATVFKPWLIKKKYVEIYSKRFGNKLELQFTSELKNQSKRIEELESASKSCLEITF